MRAKKIFSMVLVAVMCLSLPAIGGVDMVRAADTGENKEAGIESVDLVFEKTNPESLDEPIVEGKTVTSLTIDGKELVKDTDYKVGSAALTIRKKYLSKLDVGDYESVITYEDRTVQKFQLSVYKYDDDKVIKNPPLFKMSKIIIKGEKFTLNLQGITDYAEVTYSSSKSKVASVSKKGVIKGKKLGKTKITCTIVQNGAFYTVKVNVKVVTKRVGRTMNYNLKSNALVKQGGDFPEYNVYKRVYKGKNTVVKFIHVAKDAEFKFSVKKSEKKILKVGKVKLDKENGIATCTIIGKKKGWAHLTCKITQNGKTYYTRLLVRVDDGTWTTSQISKYLK